jgi:hypothetical protein
MKSKRIEVKLSLPVVAPLLDVVKAISDSLRDRLAAPLQLGELEEEIRDGWRGELIAAQNDDVRTLLALFDHEFFATGVIAFDEENAEPILRACAAVRLKLRELYLQGLDDESLETGEIEFDSLPEPTRRAFMCYLFLATTQELIIEHLDSSILEG